MQAIRNISTGPRGAYTATGELVMVEPGRVAVGDFADVNPEWFADEGGGVIIAAPTESADRPALSGKTKAELIAIAEAEGVEIEAGARVADIVAAIELAREAA